MNLYEYQAKELFAAMGIRVPRAQLARDASEVEAAIDAVGAPCVLKAQVLRGGRGKAGLIQVAETKAEAVEKARAILASPHNVKMLLVEEKLAIAKELYLSMAVDPVSATVTAMASSEGGVDIEETARTSLEKIAREPVNVFRGMLPFRVRNLLVPLGLDKAVGKQVGKIARQLYGVMEKHDATLVEINPLVVTADGECVAADGKVMIDDNALWRQKFERQVESFANDVEYEAAQEGIPYVQFDGEIGLMCAGAGLTNTICDLIYDFGGRPANFLEFGGPNYRKALEAMRLTLKSGAKVILIVTFGTIARADVMAEGIAAAIGELKPTIPIVTAIRGTGEEKAAEILRGIGLEPLEDTEEAVRNAVALAKGGAA